MTSTLGENRIEAPKPAGKGAEAPEGVHHAVGQAYGQDAPAVVPRGGADTSKGTVPEASFHKDSAGKGYIDFAPPEAKTRGIAEASKGDAQPAASERDSYKLNNAVSNFNQEITGDGHYTNSRAPITQDRVDELAKATQGMDSNQVADSLRKTLGPENYKVSKPDENGNINVDRIPVVDKGQDTRAFQLNTEKGAGIVINTFPQDNPPNH